MLLFPVSNSISLLGMFLVVVDCLFVWAKVWWVMRCWCVDVHGSIPFTQPRKERNGTQRWGNCTVLECTCVAPSACLSSIYFSFFSHVLPYKFYEDLRVTQTYLPTALRSVSYGCVSHHMEIQKMRTSSPQNNNEPPTNVILIGGEWGTLSIAPDYLLEIKRDLQR